MFSSKSFSDECLSTVKVDCINMSWCVFSMNIEHANAHSYAWVRPILNNECTTIQPIGRWWLWIRRDMHGTYRLARRKTSVPSKELGFLCVSSSTFRSAKIVDYPLFHAHRPKCPFLTVQKRWWIHCHCHSMTNITCDWQPISSLRMITVCLWEISFLYFTRMNW